MDLKESIESFLEELKNNVGISNTTHVEIGYVIEKIEDILKKSESNS